MRFLIAVFFCAYGYALAQAVALLGGDGQELDTRLVQKAVENPTPLSEKPREVPAWQGYQAVESLAVNGNPELALKQLEARLVVASDDIRALYLKGLILMQMGYVEEAERWFKMVKSNFPDKVQSYNALAVIYSGRGDVLGALSEWQALLALEPNHQNARLNSARVHLQEAYAHYLFLQENGLASDEVKRRIKILEDLQ